MTKPGRPDGKPERFDCRTREGWTPKKTKWCCEKEGLGCLLGPDGKPVQNRPPIMDGVGQPPERPTPTTGSIKPPPIADGLPPVRPTPTPYPGSVKPPPIMDGVGQPPEKPETAKPAFENGKGPIKVPTGPTTKPGRPEKEPVPMERPTPFNPNKPPERPNPGTPPERPTPTTAGSPGKPPERPTG